LVNKCVKRKRVTMPFERPNIIRPPSEWKSYYLPLTSGCSNNTCTFCAYYGSKLQIREVEDVKKEIDALALYMEHGICLPDMPDTVYTIARQWDGRRIFLQDGDALVYPFPKLKESLKYLNEKFPRLERIAAYATPQDVLRRSKDELKALRELKLSILYVGVESGDNEVLNNVGKGVNYCQIVKAGRKLREVGITSSVTVLLGLGGVEMSQEHAMGTAQILSDIDPDYAGALTLTLIHGTPLYKQWQDGEFDPVSPFQSLEELRIIVENSNFTDCLFSSVHASNYLPIQERLPQNKPKMMKALDYILTRRDPNLLRPEFMRGL
jgi:radical SAM superfamily enzyme YgiQ (UPF0313 family)